MHHEHAAMTERQSARQVQSVDKILRLVRAAIAVGVFEDRDAIGAFGPAWRRLGHFVINRP